MTNRTKLVVILAFTLLAICTIAFMPYFGIKGTLQGLFYYGEKDIAHIFLAANQRTLTIYRWVELVDLFILIPIYTYCLYQLLDMAMYNFKISPFKVFAFFPAAMDVPETVLLLINNFWFSSDPILMNLLPVLSFFKWTIGGSLIILLIIFSLAKLNGVTGMVKTISYDELWSNPKNVKTYFSWIIGHTFITALSVIIICIVMLLYDYIPFISLKTFIIAATFALIYDFVFNIFLKIPAHIFNKSYNHWLRAVFISFNSIFLMIVLGFFTGCSSMEKDVLKVGTTADYAPFSFKVNEKLVGIDIDLANELAQELGVAIEFVQTSWPNLIDDFKAKKYDIALSGISDTDKRKEFVAFSESYYSNGKTPIARCENKDKFNSILDINKKEVRVIFNPGGTNEIFAKKELSEATHILHDDNRTIFEQIIKAKADVMVTDSIEVLYQSAKHPNLCATLPNRTFTNSSIAILLPKDANLKNKVDQWLFKMKSSGKLQVIYDKYLK